MGRERWRWCSAFVVAAIVATSSLAQIEQAVAGPSALDDWFSLGGIVTSDPAVVGLDDGSIFHFARGADGALWRYAEGGDDGLGADQWRSLGGGVVGGPAAVATPTGVEVFVRGLDDAVWQRTLTAAGWSGWESLGGIVTSDPAAWPTGDLSGQTGDTGVFVRGRDGALWHRQRSGGVWEGWETLGGILVGGPGAAPGSVAVRGTDDAVYVRRYDATADHWFNWFRIPNGATSSDPSVILSGDFAYIVRGLDGAVWTATLESTAPPGQPPNAVWVWQSQGGGFRSGPAANCLPNPDPNNVPDEMVVDGRGLDDALWTRTFTTGRTSSYCY